MRRRDALHALGAGLFTLTAQQAELLAAPDWKPAVLSKSRNETVDILAELIIPRTDTPGARDAKVNRYIDLMLDGGLFPDERDEFLSGLDWLDRHCRSRLKRPFRKLTEAQQIEILTPLSEPGSDADSAGKAFFLQMKDLTIRGYYTSREGMLQELEYKGNTALADFPGCTHPEHQA